MNRLEKQMRFISEIDKLKTVYRKTSHIHSEKEENTAEHSWHMATMAGFLSEYANEKIDLHKAVKMMLIHDIVEIDAGDTYAYDKEANKDKIEREQKAAERLFGILPEDQAKEIRSLWEEFEKRLTHEAKFASAIDRLQAIIQSYNSKGKMWQKYNIIKNQVIERYKSIKDSSEILWLYAESLIKDASEKGWLK